MAGRWTLGTQESPVLMTEGQAQTQWVTSSCYHGLSTGPIPFNTLKYVVTELVTVAVKFVWY